MTELKVLTDLELDAVCGGILNGGEGGDGGTGGSAINGAALQFGGGVVGGVNLLNDQSVNGSRATANGGAGGHGGNVSIRLRF
jgi:hypothetical protein